MSVKEENKNLEKKVVVKEEEQTESTEMVVSEEKESKKAKAKKIGKTILKVAGVGAVGFIGYLLGARTSRKSEEESVNDGEVLEAEIIDEE